LTYVHEFKTYKQSSFDSLVNYYRWNKVLGRITKKKRNEFRWFDYYFVQRGLGIEKFNGRGQMRRADSADAEAIELEKKRIKRGVKYNRLYNIVVNRKKKPFEIYFKRVKKIV
jgi:hypothetical protein